MFLCSVYPELCTSIQFVLELTSIVKNSTRNWHKLSQLRMLVLNLYSIGQASGDWTAFKRNKVQQILFLRLPSLNPLTDFHDSYVKMFIVMC